ncbi:MAG TPA: response regulator transcription factor [Alphaproteobacteria bacterium]|nr:response regulator transcription factor [Alphaproteobacteria bacterium]
MKILVVEDERALSGLIEQTLMREGFGVTLAGSLAEARDRLKQPAFEAIIMDRRLPDGDGLTLVEELRKQGNSLPILMLTALGLPQERVKGLDIGADDYLAKPFSLQELLARLRSLLRRSGGPQGLKLTAGNIVVDTLHGTVQVDGKALPLGKREVQILTELMRRFGQVVGKDVLDKHNVPGKKNALEVALHRLRKDLAAHGANVKIETVRGVGYWLVDQ